MLHPSRRSFASTVIAALLAVVMALAFSCGEKPTEGTLENDTPFNGSGGIDPGKGGSFLLGSVPDSAVTRGCIEVWAMNVAFDDSTGIVSFDAQLRNRTLRNIAAPVHFVITDIRPDDISVVDFDGVSGDGHPFYDFSDKLGDDNVLTSGESSGIVTMKFHTVTPRSFALGFRIDLGPTPPPPGTGTIGGLVFRDDNQDGRRERCDRCEPGIPGITVVLVSNADGDSIGDGSDPDGERHDGDGKLTRIARTDSAGVYRFPGLPEGAYMVYVVVPRDAWKVTSTNPLLVTLVTGPDGKVQDFLRADFGLFSIRPPEPLSLFGPIIVGPMSRFGTEVDSTFVNPPSPLTVVFHYYLEVGEPPYMSPVRGIVDSAAAWINGQMVFSYHETMPPDTAYFGYRTILLPDSLVIDGENTIRLLTTGNEYAALVWRVYKTPTLK